MKVGLVGAGKRMSSTYVRLLHALNHEIVGFTTRTHSTGVTFAAMTSLDDRGSLAGLLMQRPDYLLVCVAHHALPAVLRTVLHAGVPILVETPIEDAQLASETQSAGAVVGVLEQWPYTPLEQLKSMIYDRGIIKRPYIVQNDCRTFDYHAIAQLRTYMGRSIQPRTVVGHSVVRALGSIDGAAPMQDAWEIASVKFSTGAILSHQFSYACKTAPFRSIQSLRGYSEDGTIVTGRIDDRADDYEIIDIECVYKNKHEKLVVTPVWDDGHSSSPSHLDVTGVHEITWTNPFAGLNFTDHDVGTAMHIRCMENVVNHGVNPLYNIIDATVDQQIMNAIKHACRTMSVVGFK